jgi:hypothetical protein
MQNNFCATVTIITVVLVVLGAEIVLIVTLVSS